MALSDNPPLATVVPDTTFIDIGFACVEQTLLAFHEAQNVPDVFKYKPQEWISESVELWWTLFVESCCITNELNRTNWSRSLSEGKVETVADLHERLKCDRLFLKRETFEQVRRLTPREHQALDDLDRAFDYYEHLAFEEIRAHYKR